jgi:hypothetical protein
VVRVGQPFGQRPVGRHGHHHGQLNGCVCVGLLKQTHEKQRKSLICHGLRGHPRFLWITLWKACPNPEPSRVNQGFRRVAHEKGSWMKSIKINNLRSLGV